MEQYTIKSPYNFIKVLEEKEYDSFIHRKELIDTSEYGEKEIIIDSCYSKKNGEYVGDIKTALYLQKKGISDFEKVSQSWCICSIGFCEKEQKWYGWSHRAIFGFGIGDKLFDENFTDKEDVLFSEHGDTTITTLEQAKQAAKNFSESVS